MLKLKKEEKAIEKSGGNEYMGVLMENDNKKQGIDASGIDDAITALEIAGGGGSTAQSLWLREQIESGALPSDPELLRTLLEQARKDPKLVERLVTQAKDRQGRDIFTRKANDVRGFID